MSDLTHIYCFGSPRRPAHAALRVRPRSVGHQQPATAAHGLRRRHQRVLPPPARGAALAHGELQLPDDELHRRSTDAAEIQHAGDCRCCRPGRGRSVGRRLRDGPHRARLARRWAASPTTTATTGVKITHFPVIHCRKGSIGYKLEWKGLSMIYTGDTKPEHISIEQANNGGTGAWTCSSTRWSCRPEIWAMQASTSAAAAAGRAIRSGTAASSRRHSAGQLAHAAGRVRLPAEPDRAAAAAYSGDALPGVRRHGRLRDDERAQARARHRRARGAPDVLVRPHGDQRLRGRRQIVQRRGEVLDFGSSPLPQVPGDEGVPKYHDAQGVARPVRADRPDPGDPGGTRYLLQERLLKPPPHDSQGSLGDSTSTARPQLEQMLMRWNSSVSHSCPHGQRVRNSTCNLP